MEAKKGTVKKSDPVNNEYLNDLFNKSFAEAAGALSMLTNKEMTIQSSSIELLSGEKLTDRIGEKFDELYFGSIVKMKEELNTSIVFLISEEDGLGLFDYISGNKEGTTKKVTDDIISGIGEISNILGSAFINNLANLLKKEIHALTPLYSFDMLGAILEGVIMQEEFINKKIFCANTIMKARDREVFHSRLLIMSDKDKLFELFELAERK